MSKTRNQTVTTAPDQGTQQYVQQMRNYALGGAQTALQTPMVAPQTQTVGQQAAQFFNPYQDQVIGGLNAQYDKLRQQAMTGANQDATLGGAYGGSRSAVMAGTRLGALDLGQMQQVGGLLNSGYQNAMTQGTQYGELQRQIQQQQLQQPMMQYQQAMGLLGSGMGVYGQTQTTPQTTNLLGSAAGGAMAGAQIGGPWGAVAGGGLGLLGGLFG